jgi:hypothetical protein
MNKGQVIGLTVTVLAVVGGVAVFNYFRKPKSNRDGFFSMDGNNFFSLNQSDFANADGTVRSRGNVRANCGRRNADGSYSYYFDTDGVCNKGYKTVAYFGDRNL